VLQKQQGVIDQLIDGRWTDDADDSTHSCIPSVCGNSPAAITQQQLLATAASISRRQMPTKFFR
jgi:hypothetical protein